MEVPCPVPLQRPWSPVGYQVLQVEEDIVLTPVAGAPPGGPDGPPAPPPARPPPPPRGSRVPQGGDERVPPRPAAHPPPYRPWEDPPSRKTPPWALYGSLAGGGFFFLVLVVALVGLAGQEPREP